MGVRPVAMLCCTLFCAGNVLYALVGTFDRDELFGGEFNKARVWVMLFSRFIVGTGTAINSTGRYYVSLATRLDERTSHIALLSLFQTLGFILGPGIQAGLTPIGAATPGKEGSLYFDMYTATGWVSAASGVLCFLLYLPFIFKERYIAVEEMNFFKKKEKEEDPKKKRLMRDASKMSLGPSKADKSAAKPRQLLKSYSKVSVIDGGINFSSNLEAIEDKDESDTPVAKYPPILPTFTCTYNFFAFLFNFVLLETIVTPLAMDQWGWGQEEAIFNIGMVMIGGGILSLFVFAAIGPLSKRFDERLLLLTAGMIPMIIGRVVMFPFPGAGMPPLRTVNTSLEGTTTLAPFLLQAEPLQLKNLLDNSSFHQLHEVQHLEPLTFMPGMGPLGAGPILTDTGCKYEWCHYIPKITVAQFMAGYVLATIGYPFCITLNASLYSKVLGNIPQGFWLGLLTTSGSLARVVGPLFVTEIYEQYGTYLTFGLVTGSLVFSVALTLLTYKSLSPKS